MSSKPIWNRFRLSWCAYAARLQKAVVKRTTVNDPLAVMAIKTGAFRLVKNLESESKSASMNSSAILQRSLA